jgi:hypothetical protein
MGSRQITITRRCGAIRRDATEYLAARRSPRAVVAFEALRNGSRSEMCEAPKGPAERDRDRQSQRGKAPLALSPFHPFVGETGIFVFPPAEMRERLRCGFAGRHIPRGLGRA